MLVTCYTDKLSLAKNGTINRPIKEENAYCFSNSTNCREVALSTIKKLAKYNPYYHWVLSINSSVPEEDAKRVSEILGLPITIYKVKGIFYIAGDAKDWEEFNYGLSLLLYFLKYTTSISVIFDEDAVMNTLPLPDAGRGRGQRVLVMFSWYLAFIRGFNDFLIDVKDTESGRLNGIMSFSQNVLFMRYPELVDEFVEFLKGNPEARKAAQAETYVKIKVLE